MNCKIKLFFYAVLVFKAIASIQAEPVSYEDDVTKQLDNWVSRMFKVNSDMFKKLLNTITQKEVESYSHNMKQDIYPFGQQLSFSKVSMNISEFISPQINWKFSSNKMSLFLKEFTVRIWGNLRDETDNNFIHFDTHLDMENVTFTLAINENKVSQEFKSEKNWLWFNENFSVYWEDIGSIELSDSKQDLLAKEFEIILPHVLRENLKTNEHFAKSLKAIFHVYIDPKAKLVETHKDFFTSEQKYYYLIPKIPFFDFNLRIVVVRGLSNIEAFNVGEKGAVFSSGLFIKNIRGSLFLDYGTENETPLELDYFVDFLSISTNEETDTVHVEARSFSVNRTNGDPLSYRQSANVMQKIESGLASALMPSKKAWKAIDMESEIGPLNLADKSDWKTIKQSYNNWIPFNKDQTQTHHILPQTSWIKIIIAGGRWMMNG